MYGPFQFTDNVKKGLNLKLRYCWATELQDFALRTTVNFCDLIIDHLHILMCAHIYSISNHSYENVNYMKSIIIFL